MDVLHTVTTWLDQNRYKALAVLLIAGILFYGLGCESQTAGIKDPSQKVDLAAFSAQAAQAAAGMAGERAQLMAGVEAFNAKAEALEAQIAAGMDDLAEQEKIKAELFNLAGSVITQAAAGNPVSTSAIIGTALTGLGLMGGFGALADGRRKDQVIAAQKERLATIGKITAV
jgi:hypothetical protein